MSETKAIETKTSALKSVDTVMLAILVILLGLGITVLLSASFVSAEYHKHDPYYIFNEQLINLTIAILIGVLCYFVPYQFWIKFAWWIGLIGIGMLVAMLVPGVAKEVNGASRWMLAIPFQPAEAAKLSVVIVLARYFSHYGILIKKIGYGLLVPIMLMAIYGGLIVAEIDLGGGIVVAIIIALMMIAGGVRVWHFVMLSPICLVVFKLISVMAYRIDRIVGWDDPWAYPEGVGLNIIKAFYAFANGGLTGVGPGQSQQKMFFLPESYTDYIFAVVGEELGLIGVVTISFLVLALAYRGFMTAKAAKTMSGFYLAIGMTLCVVVPSFINMMVSLSIIPAKGLPFPFFSHGGSSLMVSCAAMGIVMAIHSQSLRDLGPERAKKGLKHMAKGDGENKFP